MLTLKKLLSNLFSYSLTLIDALDTLIVSISLSILLLFKNSIFVSYKSVANKQSCGNYVFRIVVLIFRTQGVFGVRVLRFFETRVISKLSLKVASTGRLCKFPVLLVEQTVIKIIHFLVIVLNLTLVGWCVHIRIRFNY